MLLRAVFWIGLVSLLMPHEPDLGLGRPSDHGLSQDVMAAAQQAAAQPGAMCVGHEAACATGLGVLATLQNATVRGLAQVKSDLEARERLRAHNG